MSNINWDAPKVKPADDVMLIELPATCKTDATAGPDGVIQLVVEVHTRLSRTKLGIQVNAASADNTVDLSSLQDLCGKLKKDKPTTLLGYPEDKMQMTLTGVLLDSLRLPIGAVLKD